MKVGYVYDPIYLRHDTGHHVENAKRLEAILTRLEESGLNKRLTLIKPRRAETDELALIHTKQHISQVEAVARMGGGWLDSDTVMSPDSYEAALYAAGGAIKAAESVMEGEVNSAFALVRPPGHHATQSRAMGFCLFNNIAIAARYTMLKYQLERVLIIDFDVHHGNGTQAAFYNDPAVFYISTHEHPFYPGTGTVDETGEGEAKGTKVSIPFPAGCGDAEYMLAYEQVVVPMARRFKPQLILVSAGYDAHWSDQIAIMQLSVSGFARMVKTIRKLAEELCAGRLAFSLEGGYSLDALAAAVKATFDVLLGETNIEDPLGPSPHKFSPPSIAPLLKQIKEIHKLG
ncbi:MAG: histone deacetylase [Dehalococcoidia bacterium]|nr:histone deacetylase [Dehalococcoidia bacterium]